ncbi:LysM peptidoglycan-binding domain-containing protein [Naasia aerilata]|uniref:LysM domain-containing protein n=1 Tax=Naasia aerilata TaxID=1162966 RepID=A0ABN6XKA9_9MICO|nr:LysM domain-containing protein [Naasia aerilata]BDZ45299.1 hypothetical protein GCM10025866_12080 [Naasia aerilata]
MRGATKRWTGGAVLALSAVLALAACSSPPPKVVVVTVTPPPAPAPKPTATPTSTPTPPPVVAPVPTLTPNAPAQPAEPLPPGPANDLGAIPGAQGTPVADADGNLLSYTVVSGDSFFDIAQRFDVPVQQLLRMNPQIGDVGEDIYIGDVINLDWTKTG